MDRVVKLAALLSLLAACAARPGVVISSEPVANPPPHRVLRSARPPVMTPAPPADPQLDEVERELRELRDRLPTRP